MSRQNKPCGDRPFFLPLSELRGPQRDLRSDKKAKIIGLKI